MEVGRGVSGGVASPTVDQRPTTAPWDRYGARMLRGSVAKAVGPRGRRRREWPLHVRQKTDPSTNPAPTTIATSTTTVVVETVAASMPASKLDAQMSVSEAGATDEAFGPRTCSMAGPVGLKQMGVVDSAPSSRTVLPMLSHPALETLRSAFAATLKIAAAASATKRKAAQMARAHTITRCESTRRSPRRAGPAACARLRHLRLLAREQVGPRLSSVLPRPPSRCRDKSGPQTWVANPNGALGRARLLT